MAREAFYLIPTTFICKGEIPIDYRTETRKVDGRTRFTKTFAKYETVESVAVSVAEATGVRVFRDNGRAVRFLAPDAKTARAFYNAMKRG
jgi:hypothetical protein